MSLECDVVDPTQQNDDESFAGMMEAALRAPRKQVHPGDRVGGKVTHVGEKRVTVDLGGGVDGLMELSELAEPGEKPDVKVGDTLEGFALRVERGTVVMGKSAGKGLAGRYALEEAARTGVPVEGLVVEVNKGGYVVDVSGTRAFCPLGQMDTRRIDDPNTMMGRKLSFKVTELRDGKDAVLSRKAILEAEAAVRAAETRKKLSVGARFKGTVVNVRDFGAFVDVGGVEGLVPAGELAYGRNRPQDVVRVGQEVEVEVMRIEPGKDGKGERISLSMRALAEDPFNVVTGALVEGTVVRGKVTRVQPFGAFVELVPGVEGLIHVSAFGRRVAHPHDVVKPEQDVAVRVDGVDREQRRISLAFMPDAEAEGLEAPTGEAPAGLRVLGRVAQREPEPVAPTEAKAPREKPARPAPPAVGAVLEVTVDKHEQFGIFVKWADGRGLVPAGELGVPRGTDLRRSFPAGTTFKAVVQEVRADGKVRLSKSGAEHAEERAEAAAYMAKSQAPTGKGFGTLGDLLKGKLK
ncbi:MAG: S1 RNA-binding domain-containing protein [Myxococcota bacterium]